MFGFDSMICAVCGRRGWPETANTWEPYDNLAACYDVIEAFENRYCFCAVYAVIEKCSWISSCLTLVDVLSSHANLCID